jgi:hypothetical protein
MCNVVHFLFTCWHTLKRRRSRCKGTKHKVTSTSIKAACTAESFLTISMRIACGSCQQNEWERAWRTKLEKARTFYDKLAEKSFPGRQQISTLVQALEAEYTQASWDTRHLFAQGPKPSVARVRHNYYKKARSPLPREVRPEDIVEPGTKDWTEMDENDYDGNYIASTDPVHPVTTDYSHPYDDDDGSWVLQHLSPEDAETANHTDHNVDFDNHNWSWDSEEFDRDTAHGAVETTQWDTKEPETGPDEELIVGDTMNGADLIAWGPEANFTPWTGEVSMDAHDMEETERTKKIEDIIKTFWSIVANEAPPPTQQQQQPHAFSSSSPEQESSLPSLLTSLTLSIHQPRSSNEPNTPLTTPTRQQVHPSFSIDGTHDSPPSTPPRLQPRPCVESTTQHSPNSTAAWYEKQRKHLIQRKAADVKKFYSDWLLVSRCEMRDVEGLEGRVIREPGR